MNQLVVTLIVILLPGILATVIADKITIHSKWNSFKFSLYSIILGVVCYLVLQLFYYLFGLSHLKIWQFAEANNPVIPPKEVIYASIISLPIAFFAATLINYKVLNWLARILHISIKYGDENLFSYYLNAKEIDWIYIRDKENNLTYQGRIVSFSESDTMQEIVMSEVTVYRYEDSIELYSIPSVYLSKEMGKFIIEAIPENLLGENNGRETTIK